jgi:UDP-N-acetylglucosamine 2-epimerase
MKVITVIGARPQFIKAAVVSNAFRSRGIQEVILHTGQHFDSNMSDVFF